MCGPGSVREMAIYIAGRVPLGRWPYIYLYLYIYIYIYCGPGSVREMALYTVMIGFPTTRMVAYHQHSSGAGLWTGTIVSSQW